MTHTLPQNYILHTRYTLQHVIGQGGFGITYTAKDEMLDIKVCIKELFVAGNNTRGSENTVLSQTSSAFSFSDFMLRFIEEARQLAKFRHPNIVRVLDIFQENQTAYMVMEFVEGVTLKNRVQESGAFSSQEAFFIMQQLLDAVENVHKAGMLHRDIKPDNVLITKDNHVVLIDFGSARAFAEGKTTTQTAILTPGYAPPEQYSDRAQRGPFTDIYALGATMYFMLTGQKPLAVTDRVSETLQAPHELNPEISTQVSSAIMLAMQLKAEDRFQTVEELREALNILSQAHTPAPVPTTPKKKKTKAAPIIEEKSLQEKKPPKAIAPKVKKEIVPPPSPPKEKKRSSSGLILIMVIVGGGLVWAWNNGYLAKLVVHSVTNSPIDKVGIEWVAIPGGAFMMGSPTHEPGRNPEELLHEVTISPFKMSKYEVTFEQYDAFCEATHRTKPDDGGQGRGRKPVQNVTWEDAKAFADWADCRLPTEAEWEYACRAGTQTPYNTGVSISPSKANIFPGFDAVNKNVGKSNSITRLKPVGSYEPNAWGLYDMHGNAWEWCADWKGPYPTSPQKDPKGPTFGLGKVGRGGSCAFGAKYCRAAFRNAGPKDFKAPELGFRVAKD